ncbi:uncharacterized protein MELLADRAFT_114167 [Melampsora larici-populina 98AG31]|uniref:Uncharacterized protein n=1 Tax=Melampsora larici-populina (strain 98AG31 / pathotype 3-4-7) TaxID=747676 RepID=F4SCG7_MELLP|nr:uncharacterized protein MELLADRAFT_114167 [Melampsora larici-populina 98AG31]EGF97661.1 hypothetical protein MELLADRAFT_114167 [Melampsora larici-populina 98AG31]
MSDVFNVKHFHRPDDEPTDQAEIQTGNPTSKKKGPRKRRGPLDPALEELTDELVFIFDLHCKELFGDDGYCESEDYFGLDQAKKIVENLDDVNSPEDIEETMGGDIIEGGVDAVFEYIQEWKTRDTAIDYTRKMERMREEIKKTEEQQALKIITSVDVISTTFPAGPVQKKTRRTSEQVKADKEAASRKHEYNQRCIDWMKFDRVPKSKLDAREKAYQESLEIPSRLMSEIGPSVPVESGLDPKRPSHAAMFKNHIIEAGVNLFLCDWRTLLRPARPFILLTNSESWMLINYQPDV